VLGQFCADQVAMFSVVIPARNAAHVIAGQLEALARQGFSGRWEVIVVDNASNDGTREEALKFESRLPGLRVVDACEKRGRSYARNTGAGDARGDYLLFVDADDQVAEGWLQAFAVASASSDALGGRLLKFREGPGGEWVWEPERPQAAAGSVFEFLPFAPSGNFGIRNSVFRSLGGFNEGFNAGEDVELCWRLQLHGHRLAYVPEALLFTRLPTTDWGRARTAFRDAVGLTRLYREFRGSTMPRTSTSAALREWAALTRQARSRLRSVDGGRGTWFDWAGMRAGFVAGSLRHRVLYL
jgi:glycosyltransferase involved in cell wall biosynthesis